MDSTVLTLIVLLVGLALGGGAGWYFGSRPVADWKSRFEERDVTAKESSDTIARMAPELATMSDRAARADELALVLDKVRNEKDELRSELASLKSGADAREDALAERYQEREKHFDREMKRLIDAEDKLQAKFSEISEKMLTGAQSKFLEDAEKQLKTLNAESLVELEKKVGPVGETLERYRKRVEEIEKNNTTGFASLKGVIGEVRDGQRQVIDGATQITNTLRGASKARGDWGEHQFENLLESCNLRDQTDFDCQVSVDGEDGKLRPDAVINIPGGRKLVVDVKNVFNTYAAANDAETEEQRSELLKAHGREIRNQIDSLSAKRYQDFVPGSADFVIMFIPGEHVLYTALSSERGAEGGLLNYALDRNVVLSSPLNFMSIALTVATIWRQAGVQADAEEIARLGKELYDRLGVVAGHLSKLRRSLHSTNDHFDSLVGAFDGNLRVTGERFEALSVDTSAKDLPEILPVHRQPRTMRNFADSGDESKLFDQSSDAKTS